MTIVRTIDRSWAITRRTKLLHSMLSPPCSSSIECDEALNIPSFIQLIETKYYTLQSLLVDAICFVLFEASAVIDHLEFFCVFSYFLVKCTSCIILHAKLRCVSCVSNQKDVLKIIGEPKARWNIFSKAVSPSFPRVLIIWRFLLVCARISLIARGIPRQKEIQKKENKQKKNEPWEKALEGNGSGSARWWAVNSRAFSLFTLVGWPRLNLVGKYFPLIFLVYVPLFPALDCARIFCVCHETTRFDAVSGPLSRLLQRLQLPMFSRVSETAGVWRRF